MLGGQGIQRRPRRDVGYPGGGRRRSSPSSKWLRPEDGEGSGKRARTPGAGAPAGGRAWGRDLPPEFRPSRFQERA